MRDAVTGANGHDIGIYSSTEIELCSYQSRAVSWHGLTLHAFDPSPLDKMHRGPPERRYPAVICQRESRLRPARHTRHHIGGFNQHSIIRVGHRPAEHNHLQRVFRGEADTAAPYLRQHPVCRRVPSRLDVHGGNIPAVFKSATIAARQFKASVNVAVLTSMVLSGVECANV